MVVGLRSAYTLGPATGKVSGPLKVSLGVKLLILILCVLVSIIVAMTAAFLVYDSGHLRAALLSAGGAFGAAMIVCLTAAAFLVRGGSDP